MSMHEALRKIRGTVPWLSNPKEEAESAAPPTPIEEADGLVLLAKMVGQIDRESATWKAVASRAAKELILVQRSLETATDEKAAALRSRAKTLRDVLAFDEREEVKAVEDPGPDIP